MTEHVEFERIDLEKFRVIVLTYLSKELMADFAVPPVLDVEGTAIGAMMDMTLTRIKQEILGETLGVLEIKRPATWLQMLKEQHAPYWVKRRWPVRYATETHDARALYPKLALPDEKHNYVWVKTYRHAHTEPKGS